MLLEILGSTIGEVRHAAWSSFVKECSWNWTNSEAESTPSAVRCNLWFVGVGVECDRLVATVQASEVTLAAIDA